jgi:hypothetical protein
MPLQRATLRLTQLRCVTQSEDGGSEPYLWVTYFAFGVQQLPFQTGPVATVTPAYDAFRMEFPDNMKAGQVAIIPPFIASASFDVDLDTAPKPKIIGCIAVLMEEDDTPDKSIILGRIAYSEAIDRQLNNLINKRIQTGDFGPITDAEITAIKEAVQAKVTAAIGSNQSIWSKLFTDQDDNLGFVYKAFTGSEIQFNFFDFPEIRSGANRFVLSGNLFLGPVPAAPIDVCAAQRARVTAKNDEINSLHARTLVLQRLLQQAPPQQKAAIAAEIVETGVLTTQAEAELPGLRASLSACMGHHHPGGVTVDPPIVVTE